MVRDPTSLADDGDRAGGRPLLADSPEVRAVFVVRGRRHARRRHHAQDARARGRRRRARPDARCGCARSPSRRRSPSTPSLPLDEAFHLIEEHDLERVPVVEDGRLVGVLSRAVVQRRLAEDEPAEDGAGDEALLL